MFRISIVANNRFGLSINVIKCLFELSFLSFWMSLDFNEKKATSLPEIKAESINRKKSVVKINMCWKLRKKISNSMILLKTNN